MPTPLPIVDLSAAVVGTTGTIDLTPTAPTSNPAFLLQNATLVAYNESGVGLRFSGVNTGVNFDLPAGGWKDVPIPIGETTLSYSVLYVVAGATVNKLIATYYLPNESAGVGASVGNSPINGGSLSQTTQLVNLGATTVTNIINANEKPVGGQTFVASMNNDGSSQFGEGLPIVAQVSWDNVGNLTARSGTFLNGTNAVKAGSPVTLITGNQETGYCSALQNNQNNTGTTGGPANFKTTMSNIPSSITISVASSSNAPAPTAGNITLYGFSMFWVPTAAGSQTFVEATYVTVGN